MTSVWIIMVSRCSRFIRCNKKKLGGKNVNRKLLCTVNLVKTLKMYGHHVPLPQSVEKIKLGKQYKKRGGTTTESE